MLMIEMHLFTNPLHIDYFKIEPIIQKLQIEYGDYFTLNQVLFMEEDITPSTQINFVLDNQKNTYAKQKVFKPHPAYLAIKAAGFQGKQAYLRFVTQIQIAYFCEQLDIKEHSTLHNCAIKAGLDIHEFCHDLGSDNTINALQKDFKVINELDVKEMPTLIAFSSNPDEAGLLLSSTFEYNMYEKLIIDSSSFENISAKTPPSLEVFIKSNGLFQTETVTTIYNEPLHIIENELKKLILKRKVERVNIQSKTFWKAVE